MLLKDRNVIKEVPLARPEGSQKVWIDIADNLRSNLEKTAGTLGWASAILKQLPEAVDRAQLQYVGDLSLITVFIPEKDTLAPLSIILGPSVLVTAHDQPISLLAELTQELDTKSELLDSAHYLLYDILERVADEFLALMDQYEEEFDSLEEAVLNGQDRAHEVFALRHKLHHLRGILADMRRIAARLSRRQFSSTADGASDANIFVDVYDGFYHVMDNIDSLRDNLTGLVDLQLNQRSTRLNEIMKFLTIFSTIFLPLSFITGFLGMNLQRSMPELTLPYGQEITMLLMLIVVGVMLYVFKRRKWM